MATDHPYSREPGSAAETADRTRLHALDEAARLFLAWKSIVGEKVELNLDPQQLKQARVCRQHDHRSSAGDLHVAATALALPGIGPR